MGKQPGATKRYNRLLYAKAAEENALWQLRPSRALRYCERWLGVEMRQRVALRTMRKGTAKARIGALAQRIAARAAAIPMRHTAHMARGGWDRTTDMRFWRPLLYQLSYTCVSLNQSMFWICKATIRPLACLAVSLICGRHVGCVSA